MPKTIIFANGILSEPAQCQTPIAPDDTLICADGGTRHALALGLTPHLVVGDMDSLPPSDQQTLTSRGVELIRHPVDKDQTDLELAFEVAVDRGATEILLLTALGGRLDQQLANILLLTRPEWQHVRLSLAEGRQRAWLLRGPDELTLSGSPGDTLSLVPLSQTLTGLDLEQVAWPLCNKTVSLGSTLTISNRFLAKSVTIRAKSGLGLVIHLQGESSPSEF